jgi:hypothetical protein
LAFWAQYAAGGAFDIRNSALPGQRDVELRGGGFGENPQIQQQYQALLGVARQRSNQAITQADIPWESQPLVNAYFAELQEP